jgi:hypothetical protein
MVIHTRLTCRPFADDFRNNSPWKRTMERYFPEPHFSDGKTRNRKMIAGMSSENVSIPLGTHSDIFEGLFKTFSLVFR